VQHYAETPDGMAMMPEYIKEIMGAIPVAWDETRFIDGYPGKFVVIARRTGDVWYIAGINAGKEPLEITMPLPFINQNNGILVTEGGIPRSFMQKEITLDGGAVAPIRVNADGGFVIRFDPSETIKPENE
jgi:alpha-glucosidase